jgi:hypothetical protein
MQINQQRLLIHSLCLFFFFLLLLAGCKTTGPASPNRGLPAQQTGAKTSLPRISAAPPAGWGVVLDAAFDPGTRGWPIRDDDTAELSVSGGAYQAVVKEKYHSVRLLKKTGMNSLAPFHIQLALQNRSGDQSHFGLLFGGADRNNTYRFTIGPGGRVKTAKYVAGRYQEMFKKKSPAAVRESGGAYLLELRQKDAEWIFSVNGLETHRLPAQALMGDKVGVYAYNRQRTDFDRLRVMQADALPDAYQSYERFARRLSEKGERIQNARLSRDGSRLATFSLIEGQGFLALWDASQETAPLLAWRRVPHPVAGKDEANNNVYFTSTLTNKRFALSPDGRFSAVAYWADGDTSRLRIETFAWDDPEKSLVRVKRRVSNMHVLPGGIAFSPDNRKIAICSAAQRPGQYEFKANEICILELDGAKMLKTLRPGADGAHFDQNLRWSPGGGYLAVVCDRRGNAAGKNPYWELYNAAGDVFFPLKQFSEGFEFRKPASLAFSADDRRMSLLDQNGPVQFFDTREGFENGLQAKGEQPGWVSAFGPEGQWAMASKGKLRPFLVQKDRVIALAGKRFGGHCLDMTYAPEQKGWRLACEQKIEFIADYAANETNACRLLAEAQKLFAVGFVKQGQARARAALESDPGLHALDRNAYYFDILPALAAKAGPAAPGEMLRLQYKLARNGEKTALAGLSPAEIGSMLYGLFNYGLYAARAGQPGLTMEAAAALSDLADTYPAALNEKIFKKYAALLQALAAAQQGDRDKGFNRLLETGLTKHQKKYIREMPRVFAPFYKEREKLAYILETDAADLPAAPRTFRTPRSYPALSGRMIRPPEAPRLQKRPGKTPPSSQAAPRDTGGAVILE